MIRPRNGFKHVYVYREPVDLRKAVNGLSLIVEETLDADPFDGALYVFTNRRRDRLKILYYERNGFCLWYKRLEKDRFQWPRMDGETLKLSGQELNWLLDGYDVSRVPPHKKYRYKTVR